jgi:small-conductance mechanosensitive channel
MQLEWAEWIRRIFSAEVAFTLAIVLLVLGAILAYATWRYLHTLLANVGVPEAVEGTPFERTALGLGTSSVGIIATLSGIFVYVLAIFLALNVAQLLEQPPIWERVTIFLPDLFIAALALIVGIIAGDKAKLVVSERLRSVKLPAAGILPELVKYSIFYLAAIVALGQVGIATGALLILLGAYAVGLVVLSGLAFKDLLAAGAAGLYLVLSQPYGIGDEVEIDGRRGIVQEVDMFVTRIEGDDEEFIVPNQRIFRSGIVRYRE